MLLKSLAFIALGLRSEHFEVIKRGDTATAIALIFFLEMLVLDSGKGNLKSGGLAGDLMPVSCLFSAGRTRNV